MDLMLIRYVPLEVTALSTNVVNYTWWMVRLGVLGVVLMKQEDTLEKFLLLKKEQYVS